MKDHSAIASLCLLMLTAGCARVNPRPAFQDVSGIVASRTDRSIEWARDAAETEQLELRASKLLGQTLTAETAAQVALFKNRKLQASFEDIAVAQADLVQAGLLSNPEFGLSIRFSSEAPSLSNLEFGLAQDFLDFLLLSPRKKIAVAELEHSKLMVATEVLDLIAEVKSAYYTLQAGQQLADRLGLILQINEAAAELAERQYEAGTMNDLARANHRATYQQSKVDLAQAKLQVRLDRERLNRLLGLWGKDTSWRIGPQLPAIPEQEITLERLESLAISQRLDIEAARWGVNIFGRALALKRGTRFFPLGVHIGVSSERETDGEWVTGPTVSLGLPIFDQGQASVARLQAQMFHQQRHLEALAVEVRSRVREARDLLIATRDMTEFYKHKLLPQRVAILDQTQRHYNMMLKGTYDLLLAKQNEVEAERAYILAWRDYWLARTQLERALGGRLPGAETSQNPDKNTAVVKEDSVEGNEK